MLQLVTGSTGLDDYEWGVTLFGVHPDDLKDVRLHDALRRGVVALRRVRPFFTGQVGTLDEVLAEPGSGPDTAHGALRVHRHSAAVIRCDRRNEDGHMRKTVTALVLAVVVCLSGLASGRGAQEQPTTTTTVAGGDQPAGRGEAVQGTLRYQDENGDDVLSRAGLVVKTESGDEVEAVTDRRGRHVPRRGAGTGPVHGHHRPRHAARRGVARGRGPGPLTFTVGRDQARTVLFRITSGEGGGGGSTTLDRALRLAVEGIQFGLIIAICAIGLSLIFGTTGLTNFAHGEMVTFGALVAFLLNQTLGLHLLIAAAARDRRLGALAGAVLDRVLLAPAATAGAPA